MGCRQAIFNALKTADTVAADYALDAALGRVEGPVARLAVETLIARHTRDSLKALVGNWHRLDATLHELVLANADDLFTVLRDAFTSSEEQTRVNVAKIIGQAKFYRAAYLLDSAARDRAPAVRDTAVKILHALVDNLLTATPVWDAASGAECTPEEIHKYMVELESHQEDRRQLASAVDGALASFDLHQHVGIVEASMWLTDDMGPRLWKALLVPGSRLLRAAQGLLARARNPRLVPFMLQALSYSEFRPAVAQLLATCSEQSFLEAWFRESWRLVQPKSSRVLNAVRDVDCTRNQLLDVISLPDEVQRSFPRCILATGLTDEVKVEVIKELFRRGQPEARRAALWALVGMSDQRATSVLRTIAAEQDANYAPIARCELSRRRPLDYPLDTLLHARVKPHTEKAEPAERMTAVVYWLSFDRMTELDKVRLGKELHADGRLPFETINGWLASPEPSDRVRALRIVALLDVATDFEEQLYRVCRDPHPEVRSAAVAAMGKLPTATTRRLLQNALYDPDPRVQANSVEALDLLGAESAEGDLVLKLASPDNRTRANAVKALLRLGVRNAASTLLLMLKHENRAHRASALWLVEQMRLLPLASRVLEMAETEGDDQLRDRAKMLARRMTNDWAAPAAGVAQAGQEVTI